MCDKCKQESSSSKEYGNRRIDRNDGIDIIQIHVGFHRKPFDQSSIIWRVDSEMAEYTGNGEWLTLNEIRDLIWNKIGRDIIEVRIESPLSGVIYQVGNHDDDTWQKHGTTRGYA